MTYNLYKHELRLSFVLLYSAYLLELAAVQRNIQRDLHEIENEKKLPMYTSWDRFTDID